MLNLILDTNAWIYLANGFNPIKKAYEDDGHFQMADWIVSKSTAGECRLFSNYIIRLEWDRNRIQCEELIKKYEAQIQHEANSLKNKRRSTEFLALAKVANERTNQLKDLIIKNKKHIQNVEEILAKALDIPISDPQKLAVVDWAIRKQAPFHHKDNSVGDALIFLSTAEYFFYDEENLYIENTILVSNNSSDFGEKNNSAVLHPDLAKYLKDKPILFEGNLAKALQQGERIIEKYNEYIAYTRRDYVTCEMNCKGVEYMMGEVEFQSVLTNIENVQLDYSPYQQRIEFGEGFDLTVAEIKELEENRFKRIDVGYCNFCNALHVRCFCGEITATYDDDLTCSCGMELNDSTNTRPNNQY